VELPRVAPATGLPGSGRVNPIPRGESCSAGWSVTQSQEFSRARYQNSWRYRWIRTRWQERGQIRCGRSYRAGTQQEHRFDLETVVGWLHRFRANATKAILFEHQAALGSW